MSMTIHCDIVSAEEEMFSGLIEMLVATGDLGELVRRGRLRSLAHGELP